MERRDFLSGVAGAAALGFSGEQPERQSAATAGSQHGGREYYLLRKYQLTRAQAAGCDHYLETALLPALARLGFRDVGAFGLEYGPETPATYLLVPVADSARLLRLEQDLLTDAEYMRSASTFRTALAVSPSFGRVDDTVLYAFEGHPKLVVPPAGKRILQLRTYESPSLADYFRKVEMFHSGEFEIFAACGMRAVFYAHAVAGQRMPALAYMLRFDSLTDLEARWDQFRVNPDWARLQKDPRFSGEDLVSNITNLVLTPKPFSAL